MPEDLGQRIREIRERRGMTQSELASAMRKRGNKSITQQRQSEVEDNIRRVTVDEAISYARILCVPLSELLGVPDFEES